MACARRHAERADCGHRSRGQQPSDLCADDLLPVLVYVIVRAHASSLPAELMYTTDFLPRAYQGGRLGYAVASVSSACRVVMELDWSCGGLIIPVEVESETTIVE